VFFWIAAPHSAACNDREVIIFASFMPFYVLLCRSRAGRNPWIYNNEKSYQTTFLSAYLYYFLDACLHGNDEGVAQKDEKEHENNKESKGIHKKDKE
jgi:hypothetical protein